MEFGEHPGRGISRPLPSRLHMVRDNTPAYRKYLVAGVAACLPNGDRRDPIVPAMPV